MFTRSTTPTPSEVDFELLPHIDTSMQMDDFRGRAYAELINSGADYLLVRGKASQLVELSDFVESQSTLKVTKIEPSNDLSNGKQEMYLKLSRSDGLFENLFYEDGYDVSRYSIPAGDSMKRLRFLERKPGTKLSLSELAPHKGAHGTGVDNTGNVRVWPAEQVILVSCLISPVPTK
jgi:hypothetical protein